ncbi:protein FORGETTER 1-like [Gigantopelta aegis]|uniref:protein FORGETTER 1-like n=1 Tax=Gigantopelta aegis TaxID=1735272 RepID=UPI001B88AB3B|nr:protein FORGETTER 1-like [Gigantopelta aegis]XP_041357026.1 protein FORGETTER 1-like [Gigantopelta aegis]
MNAAHTAFLATQSASDPIIQQIEWLNQRFHQYVPPLSQQAPQQQVVQSPSVPDDAAGVEEGLHETVCEEVFSSYPFREVVPGCRAHPGDIVEAGPLAALSLPAEFYPITDSIPRDVVVSGNLSSLQLEGIIHACQRHQVILANGQRAGFFIGDGAGVGKGRQIAGIILDNFARGRTKHVWFTISSDLIVDSRRDLTDIGCYVKVIDGCHELDRETRVFGLPSDFKEGVIFSTYATLVSSVQKGGSFSSTRTSRLQQLIKWCGGEDFDGCLIFDECHKAKNFIPNKEHASTKVALAVSSIQRMLPKARVVYCSATGITDVKNMAFMERLGLWGDGAPFKSFPHFLESVQRKGLGVSEMLAMEMKASGMYVSRGLSFKQAEFVTVEAPLTKEQIKVYNQATHVWNELRKALDSAMLRTNCSNNRLWAQFWSSHQRFFKQLCMGMKVPTVVKEAQQALDSGCCVVIGLQTTGEASLVSELTKSKGTLKGFVSLCREILSRFIQQYFPIKIEGVKEVDQPDDEWSVQAKKMLLAFANKIDLPHSPLDEMIDELGGPDGVSEMTGRKGRIVRRSQKEIPVYEVRGQESDSCIESLNVKERNMFMEGKKLVAIISDAASTGISLHSDLRVANQRRRIHLTVELAWSADKAVQQLGRSHRSNQSCGPLYKLLTTDLGGERRFAAAVARRLQSLGALTKGDRRAATGADLTEFNFDTPYGRSALRTMYYSICQKKCIPGVDLDVVTNSKYEFEEFNSIMQECLVLMGLVEVDTLRSGAQVKEKDTGNVSMFLNRILGLSVEKQNLIFSYFTECLNVTVEGAKKEGRYNEGMLDITASSVNMIGKPKQVFKNFTKGSGPTKSVLLNVDRGMSWDAAMVRMDNHSGRLNGFYISKREMWGRKRYILATQKENSTHLFKIARPNTGLSPLDEEKTDLLHKYLIITPEKAEEGWKCQYEESHDGCLHGKSCRNKGVCTVGSRCYKLHLLCGNNVTLMSVLETAINKSAAKFGLSKYESQLRVVRVELDGGERVVGIRFPEILIPEVERLLKEHEIVKQATLPSLSQTPSLDPTPVTEIQKTSSSNNHTTEEVTSINDKCLTRAINPPVTIRNFFKPRSKVDGAVKTNNTQKTPVVDLLDSSDRISNTLEDSSKNTSPSKDSSTNSAGSAKISRKRSLVDSSVDMPRPLAKRSKQQCSLLNSFSKQSAKEVSKKVPSCPVCAKMFNTDTSNEEINSHIDSCLIE